MRRHAWSRTAAIGVSVSVISSVIAALAPVSAATEPAGSRGGPADHGRNPQVYELPGATSGDGSKFEGIGLDERRSVFYVSETTGGEISRGRLGDPKAKPWLDGNGTDGRFTARGIDVDRAGRVFIAGGPNSTQHPGAPDLWVYSAGGRLLAALPAGANGAVFNDVTIARDGAAYFTDSSLTPRIFRVAQEGGRWTIETWLDATGTVPTSGEFNLNGIAATRDGRALIVVQTTGALWRVDLGTKAITPIALDGLTGADLAGGDGIVLRGKKLYVVRNFPRVLTEVRLTDGFTRARFVAAASR